MHDQATEVLDRADIRPHHRSADGDGAGPNDRRMPVRGSGAAVTITGPAVQVTCLLADLLVVLLMTMRAETVAATPVPGAFSTLAGRRPTAAGR